GEFHVNGHRPPLPFDDDAFDVVSTTSVFTHLDEIDQFLWLGELRRVLKPGGVLLASVHGRECVRHYPSWVRRRIAEKGFVYARTDAESKWFPSWYQVAWHSREYIDREWSRLFSIRDYLPQAINGYQDLVVAQKQTVSALRAA
ncbi:MAG: class I SAM-dependent methyltransferase, partial [Planctomycetaceae bacterium]